MNSSPEKIGMRIKVARKAANLSQTQLATRLNKTMRTIQKYESGEIEPSISMVTCISKILDVSPEELIGYQQPNIHLETLSDIISILDQLNRKSGVRFEIDVKHPPESEEWECSLKFNGNDQSAPLNESLCMILEDFRDERDALESYRTDSKAFDRWIDKELVYYANSKFEDREIEVLTDLERLQRRNELDCRKIEQIKHCNQCNDDPDEQ